MNGQRQDSSKPASRRRVLQQQSTLERGTMGFFLPFFRSGAKPLKIRTSVLMALAVMASFLTAPLAHATFHLMQIEQVIGGVNGDSTVQAVQLRMRAPGQSFVSGAKLFAYDATGSNPVLLIQFPSDVSHSSSGSTILIATSNFSTHTTPALTPDFTFTNPIPSSYLAAGRIVYTDSSNNILWSLAFGGTSYTGSDTGTMTNDSDGNFAPAFADPLPSANGQALLFQGSASAASTNNAADYAVTPGAATFTNNAGATGVIIDNTVSIPTVTRGAARVGLQSVATGLVSPNDLVSANDGTGRLFVVDQAGKVWLIKNGQLASQPFLDVTSRLVTLDTDYDERGLLGLAFHPGFSNPASPGYRKLYTYTSEPVNGTADFTVTMTGSPDHQSVVTEWQVSAADADVVDTSTRREVMRVDEPEFNHNGGKLAFRSSDGYLYISLGDGGNANDVGDGHSVSGNGQDIHVVLGKILRIDPLDPSLTTGSSDAASANGKYRVPASNPFVGVDGVDEIYAYGLRNPFRYSFDITTGVDRLVAGDVGQNSVEEVDVVDLGKNYGWNKKEGSFLFDSATADISVDLSPDPSLTEPVLEYGHSDGSAIIGGYVYRGNGIPELAGKYIFGDFSQSFVTPAGRLFYAEIGTAGIHELKVGFNHAGPGLFLKGFGADENGELYVLGAQDLGPTGTTGEVLKIVPIPEKIAVGSGLKTASSVRILNAVSGTEDTVLAGHASSFNHGSPVALGDVNGDGVADIIVGTGPGEKPEVQVFDGVTHTQLASFLAYPASFRGGVFVAAGDVNGDGEAEIITGPGSGAAPDVKIFNGDGTQLLKTIPAYKKSFHGGVRVAVGDVDNDGSAEIITAPGAGMQKPVVEIFKMDGTLVSSITAYSNAFHGGVFVAAGDVNGDGKADIITGPGSGAPLVKAFQASGTLITSLEAFASSMHKGVHVGAADVNGDGATDILACPAAGKDQTVRAIDAGTGDILREFSGFSTGGGTGVYVTGSGD